LAVPGRAITSWAGYEDGGYRYAGPTPAGDRGQWVFAGLEPGIYRVSATWPAHPSVANDTPYTVLGGVTSVTKRFDQKADPVGELDHGVLWEEIAPAYRLEGGALTVEISDGANNFILADAVRVEWLRELTGSLTVVDAAGSARGARIALSGPFDPGPLNLYRGPDETDKSADVTLVGKNVGAVAGSLVWEEPARSLYYLPTGGLLPADDYTLTISAATDGLADQDGEPLDGDGDGFPGGDFAAEFTVDPVEAIVVGLPDFSAGPGQAIDLAGTGGLPVSVDRSEGIERVSLTLLFDPALLEVTGADPAADLPAGWRIESLNLDTPGAATLELVGDAPLPAGLRQLIVLKAAVPDTLEFGYAERLRFVSLRVNGGELPAAGDEAVHLVAFRGDATGNKDFSALDASLVARVAVGNDTGFDAFRWIDPVILGDVTGDGGISALDASWVARKAVGLPQSEVPNIPPQGVGSVSLRIASDSTADSSLATAARASESNAKGDSITAAEVFTAPATGESLANEPEAESGRSGSVDLDETSDRESSVLPPPLLAGLAADEVETADAVSPGSQDDFEADVDSFFAGFGLDADFLTGQDLLG